MIDPYIAGAASLSIPAYTVTSINASIQKRKIKEAEARVRVAELELEKLRHVPKHATSLEQEYSFGLREQEVSQLSSQQEREKSNA